MDNIDGLRALAILSVLAFHYTSRFTPDFYRAISMPFHAPLGWMGVDLFFAVSGYCIFMTLESAGRLETFWAKRIARIEPAYVAGVLLCFAVVRLAGLGSRETSLGIAVSNLLWFNLEPTWPMVDSAYWSLAVELKFYFWLGLLYYLAPGRSLSTLWAGFCAVGVATLMAKGHLGLAGKLLGGLSDRVLIANYAPQFLVGLCAYEYRRMSTVRLAVLLAAAAAMLMVLPRFVGVRLDIVAALAFAFTVLQMPWLRLPRPITYIGLVSYSLYIVHQNIGYVVIRELASPIPSIVLRVLLAFAISLGIAALFARSIETRWQRSLTRLIDNWLMAIVGVVPILRRRRSTINRARDW